MAQFVARGVEIHAVWRSTNELFAYVHAPNVNFHGSGSHHFTGPFRIVMDIYDTFGTREHCSRVRNFGSVGKSGEVNFSSDSYRGTCGAMFSAK